MFFSVWDGKACTCTTFTGNCHARIWHTQMAVLPPCLCCDVSPSWLFQAMVGGLYFSTGNLDEHSSSSLYSSCQRPSFFHWILGIYAPYMMVRWYPQGGVVYKLRFRPSGVSDRIVSIQWLSLRFGWLVSSLRIFSNTMMERSFIERSDRVKNWATGLSVRWWLMSDWWPVKRTPSAFSVSPTYWMALFYIQ